MAGNRKHGFLRGNGGGVRPSEWLCHGCGKNHEGRRSRNRTLDGRDLCDRQYYKAVATPEYQALARKRQAGANLNAALRRHGIAPETSEQALQLWNDGYLLFCFPEQDNEPLRVTDMEMLGNYSADRLLALAPQYHADGVSATA